MTLQKYPKNFAFQLFIILHQFNREICYFLKKQPTFKQFLLSFLFINKNVRLNNLKTRTAMNAKTSIFVICVETIIYLLLYNVHDCTFNSCFNKDFLILMTPLCHRLFVFNQNIFAFNHFNPIYFSFNNIYLYSIKSKWVQ